MANTHTHYCKIDFNKCKYFNKNLSAERESNKKKSALIRIICVRNFVLCFASYRAMGWTIGVLGFDSRRGVGIFLFTTASRTALGPTQPPIQWVPGALSLGVKRPGREASHSPLSSAEVKECVELYLHSPNTPSRRGARLKHRYNFTFYLYTATWSRVLQKVLVAQLVKKSTDFMEHVSSLPCSQVPPLDPILS
jgi:hypothetical protein